MNSGDLMRNVREGRDVIRQEGLAAFFRKALVYCFRAVYWRREWYLWRNDAGLTGGPPLPDEARYELKVVSTPEDLTELLAAGYSIGEPFTAEDPGRMLVGPKEGLLLFEEKELTWWGWAVMDAGVSIFPPVKHMDYTTEAYVCHLFTMPRRRGMGLGTYGLRRLLAYVMGKGKSEVVLATLKDNPAAVKIQEKAGLRIYGEIRLTRVLMMGFWSERRYDQPMKFLTQQLGDARRIAQREGMGSLVRRSLGYFMRVFLWRQSWHIWRSEVGGSAGAPAAEMAGTRFEVVSGPEDLDRLVSRGLLIRPPFFVEDARRMLAEGEVGLMTFMDNTIASWVWATTGEGGRIYPPLKKIDYTSEAYLGHAVTGPRYRGMGLIVYEYNRQTEFLRGKGKSVAISTTLTGNDAARRVEEKLGSSRCGEVKLVRVLMHEFWTEKWDDGR